MAVVGIRREDKSVWERRTPLVPADVKRLVDGGIRILVQSSENRCFADAEFAAAGAEVVDDLGAADVILGVKEVPVAQIAAGRTYLFFSHTIKGQPYNMPLLRRLLERGCTLLDYELVANDAGVRTIAFGRHAGLAGAIDTLHDLQPALATGEVAPARAAIEAAGRRIADEGLPEAVSPLVIGVTGEGGKVWGGACEILDALPVRWIEAEDLARETEAFTGSARDIWAVSYGPGDLVEPTDPSHAYSWDDYVRHPGKYRARFGPHLRHLAAVIHGIFWAEGYPRFLLAEDVRRLFADGARPRLELVTDVTCDLGGSNELLARVTDPGAPAYVVSPSTGETTPGLDGEGVAVWAVDILPSEIPVDASRQFSQVLSPMIPSLARDDVADRPDDDAFPGELRRAYLAVRGRLLPEWEERLAGPLAEHGAATHG